MAFAQKQIAAIILLRELHQLQVDTEKKTRERKCWVKPLLLKRSEHDIEAHLLKDLLWDEDDFKNFTRFTIGDFEHILSLVESRIQKEDTVMRLAIPARTKLAITLRYLATGDSYRSLEYLSRVSRNTTAAFMPKVLRAIYDSLQSQFLRVPQTEEEWLQNAADFNYLWQFPHTLGALDGKHIRIKAPANTGSQFYNFKGFYSIVLFASVDAHGRFSFVDVGCNGKVSDSTIFQEGYLYKGIREHTLHIPNACDLAPGLNNKIPFFFIGDDAFALDKHVMKPYNRSIKLNVAKEVFNYRLCRARMVVECAFGRLAKRFCIFQRPIEVLPSTVDLIVLTCCVLHNYLTKKRATPMPQDYELNVSQPSTFSSIGPQSSNQHNIGSRVRNAIANYCICEGDVEFQWSKLNLKK